MSIFNLFTKTENQMAKRTTNLNKVKNQASFLEKHLRGTGRTISVAQAKANYGIEKLTARISELRSAGLQVKTLVNSTGNTAYRISARDVNGSRAKMFTAN
jgi:phosphoribosylformylglycinamidine (FGAM) synthase-like amidotransferase family enzyme